MKICIYIYILFFLSCIDFITNTNQYYSLSFNGGSWIEIAQLDSMKLGERKNNFTLQFWVSGGNLDTNEAPVLFSLIDSEDSIKLACYRDKGNFKSINTIINSQVLNPIENNKLDWSDPNQFNLISFLFSDTSEIEIYLNDVNYKLEGNTKININDTYFIIGGLINKELTIIENFWYGYIDEVRLWNTLLSDSTIKFQSEYPSKLGQSYRYTDEEGNEISTYLDSLIGIWRLNFDEPKSIIEDDSGYQNHGNIFSLSGFTIELSKKGAR